MTKEKFASVWDAIEDDPVKRQIYKLRSELVHVITSHINANRLKQREVAELLGISQPRVSSLMNGNLQSFRLDTLVGFAVKCGHSVSIDAAQIGVRSRCQEQVAFAGLSCENVGQH